MPEIGRIINVKRAMYLLLPKKLMDEITWRVGDRVALRPAGDKLICERVPLEKLAILRTGEPQLAPANSERAE
jgi:hypothetical protein